MANFIYCASFLPTAIDETTTNELVVQIRHEETWLDYASIKETADLPHVRRLLTDPNYRVLDMRRPEPAPVAPPYWTWLDVATAVYAYGEVTVKTYDSVSESVLDRQAHTYRVDAKAQPNDLLIGTERRTDGSAIIFAFAA